MAVIITNTFKQLLARACNGEAGAVIPSTGKLGNGLYNAGIVTDPSANAVDLAAPFAGLTGITVTRSRVGARLQIVLTKIPDGTSRTITEAGLFNSSGEALLLDSFRPIILPASGGVGITLMYNIFGEL